MYWNMERKYVIRRRAVFGAAAAVATIAVFVLMTIVGGNLWWIDGGYCWGSVDECVFNTTP